MTRVAIAPLLALGVAAGLLIAACSSPAATTDSRSVGQYGAGQGTSMPMAGPGTMAPGGQGARATAAAMGTVVAGTPGPLRVQATLRNMDQLREQLRILASNSPTPVQLLAMVQSASDLMYELSRDVSLMTPQQQDQAFRMMSDTVTEMSQVVQTYANQLSATMAPGTMTPGTMTPATPAGTPGATMQGTSTPSVMSVQQMMAAILQLRQQEMNLANDQPTYEDINNILGQINQMLVSIDQQLGSLSTSDLETLTAGLAQAMADLGPVMRTRIRLDTGSVPTVAPNQTVLPTLSVTPTLGPTTVLPTSPTEAASPTPMPMATPGMAIPTPTP